MWDGEEGGRGEEACRHDTSYDPSRGSVSPTYSHSVLPHVFVKTRELIDTVHDYSRTFVLQITRKSRT